MGIFANQIGRLVRTKWTTAQALAEEIIAIFNSDEEIVIDSPVRLEGDNDGNIPLTIFTPIDSAGNPIPPIGTGTNGGTPNPFTLPEGIEPFTPPDEPEQPSAGADPDPITFVGRITGHTSGTNYTCNVWKKRVSGAPFGTVIAEMMNLDPESILPNGTYVMIVNNTEVTRNSKGEIIGTTDFFYGFPPVFLPFQA